MEVEGEVECPCCGKVFIAMLNAECEDFRFDMG